MTQSALWQLVFGLAGVILTLAGLLCVVDKCATERSEEIAKRATAPRATDVGAPAPDRGHGQAHHESLP